jgi:hypothetical protein
LVGNSADMAIGAAGRDDHAVGERGFAMEVDGDDVFRLGVFKLGKDGVQQGGLLGAFGRGRGFRGAFRRSGFLRLCWQGCCPLVTCRSSLRLRLALSGGEQPSE